MDRSIFRYILRHSLRPQILILVLTLGSFPFLYATLELPKLIINDALSTRGLREIAGVEVGQVHYLFVLCGLFLVLVLINGAFKYVINVYVGITGERMLRRLRYELYSRIMRFPLPHFRRVSSGELTTMITAEVEPLGGFMGDAFSLPLYQGGQLLTILVFMFVQDPIMGLAAVVLYPIQVYIVPKLQRQVNALGKQRVRQVRRLSERVSETVGGVRDLRANDATVFERTRFGRELGVVFDIRYQIYKKKFFIKFFNNFLAQLGPFFFFSIGGYLVIMGDLTLGALVAALTAHEKLYAPWKELLSYYQLMSDAQIKYEVVVAQFDPQRLRPENLQTDDPDGDVDFRGPLRALNLTVVTDENETVLDSTGFQVDLPARIAIIGPAGSGKEELTLVLGNLLEPDAGRILINDHELQKMCEAITGRRMTYVGYPAQIFRGTVADNLFFGLKHRPLTAPERDPAAKEVFERERHEARRSGNPDFDLDADWIDYRAAGLDGPDAIASAATKVLGKVHLDRDVYQMGLRGTVDPDRHPGLAERVLEARRALRTRLQDPRLGRLVETWDPNRYNTNATLAENLLFGTPIGEELDPEHLAAHPYVVEVIGRSGLRHALLDVGLRLAGTMVELFADLPPDHEYFRQFSFISADELPEFRALVGQADPQRLSTLSPDRQERLISLTFKLIPARHRLGLVEEDLQAKLLEARHRFREMLPEGLQAAIAFFDPDRYNAAASLQDNVLFGKVAYGQAQAAERISDLLSEVLDELDLHDRVIEVGLQAQTGVGGSRLSLGQRQKLALARALLKRPEVLILYDAIGPLDPHEQSEIREMLLAEFENRTLIWALTRSEEAEPFDRVLVMRGGRIVEQGRYNELGGGTLAAAE
ncbi:MAG TPA: ABC transporter ATP-binding protein [Geminicoccaceae bacterium]